MHFTFPSIDWSRFWKAPSLYSHQHHHIYNPKIGTTIVWGVKDWRNIRLIKTDTLQHFPGRNNKQLSIHETHIKDRKKQKKKKKLSFQRTPYSTTYTSFSVDSRPVAQCLEVSVNRSDCKRHTCRISGHSARTFCSCPPWASDQPPSRPRQHRPRQEACTRRSPCPWDS